MASSWWHKLNAMCEQSSYKEFLALDFFLLVLFYKAFFTLIEFDSNSQTLDIWRKRGSQPSISWFNSSWIDGHSTKKTWQNHNIPSRSFCSREAPADSICGKDSSSPRSLFLLISRWQNTSMTGWLCATRTLRNIRYATKAARDRIVLTLGSINICHLFMIKCQTLKCWRQSREEKTQ